MGFGKLGIDYSSKGNFKWWEFRSIARSSIYSSLTMRKMASLLGAFRVNEIAEALLSRSDSVFCLPIGLVIISGCHIQINFSITHEYHPEVEGHLGVSIWDDRGMKTRLSEVSFNEEVSSFNSKNVLGNWDEVREPNEVIQHNEYWFLLVVARE